MFAAAGELDLEGIVAKRKDSPHSAETIWYKIKPLVLPDGRPVGEVYTSAGAVNAH